jgi:glycosyltransferase involved in cell wall biosynthesis
MTSSLISIVTPSFNQAEFIEETILSVITQDYARREYLIFDGGSTDGTVDIIRRHADKVDYWVSEQDRGQSHAINKGFALASGDVLTWLNSDDVYLPGALSAVAECFQRQPEVDLVYGNFIYTDIHGRVLRRRKVSPRISYDQLVFHDYLGQPAVFFRRSLLEQIGAVNESLNYSMDWELFLRMWKVAKPLHLARELATFRLNHLAKTNCEDDAKWQREREMIQRRYMRQPFASERVNRAWQRYQFLRSFGDRAWAVIRDNPIDYTRTLWRMFPGRRFFKLWAARLRPPV